MPIDYLQKILTAKVYDVAIETPLDFAPTLSRRIGNRVLLKREDQQPVFSFKRTCPPRSALAACSRRRPATTRRASRSRRSAWGARRRS